MRRSQAVPRWLELSTQEVIAPALVVVQAPAPVVQAPIVETVVAPPVVAAAPVIETFAAPTVMAAAPVFETFASAMTMATPMTTMLHSMLIRPKQR